MAEEAEQVREHHCIRFRNIRTIFNLAIDMELVKQEDYPFKKFKVSKLHQETAKRALSKDEILAV